jgi:hypothetical protein
MTDERSWLRFTAKMAASMASHTAKDSTLPYLVPSDISTSLLMLAVGRRRWLVGGIADIG